MTSPAQRFSRNLHPADLQITTMSNPVVFFDVSAGGSPLGRIEMTVREYDPPWHQTLCLSFRLVISVSLILLLTSFSY